ncbi:MAG: WG repeat-containing protein [Bacteroidia bacterium]|jgi:hypothetical protein
MIRIALWVTLLGGAFTLKAQTTTLFPIEIKGKWGYMDAAGSMKIEARYDLAMEFNEGIAIVALANLPCAINTENQRIIDTGLYQFMGGYSEGLCYVRDFKNNKAFINAQGEKIIVLPDSIYDARPFHNGLAVLGYQYDKHEIKFEVDISTIAFHFAYIDKTGNNITGYIYDDADDMHNGVARFKKGTLFGVMDSTGKEIIPAKYILLDDFFEGKAVFNEGGKFGFINRKGEVIIPPTFDMAFDFNEGMAGVWNKGKFGFIDSTGKVAVPIQYEQIRSFSENLAAVQKDGKWGFINKAGDLVIVNRFDNASVFREGLCAVLVKRHWGFIDRTGKMVVPTDFDAVGSFDNGVADVVYHDIAMYIDRRGNILPRLKK